MSDYRVIDCDLHDLYEIAILRRRELLLSWLDEDGVGRLERVRPTDLRTVAGAEFLLASDSYGRPLRIRLDRIRRARDLATGEDFAVAP